MLRNKNTKRRKSFFFSKKILFLFFSLSLFNKNKMKIVISGGGISGLSLASFLSRMLPKTSSTSNPNTKKRIEKNNNTSSITIVERSKDVAMRRAGGGIGLWPTSLSVLRSLPSVDSVLREKGFWMPSAGFCFLFFFIFFYFFLFFFIFFFIFFYFLFFYFFIFLFFYFFMK